MSSSLLPRSDWGLEPDIRFLNHGSFGAAPLAVLEHQRELQRQAEAEPVRFYARELTERIDHARSRLAEFVGASVSNLVFVSNATTAVNAVLRSFPFEAGDELLVTNHGYNACRNVAEFVCQQAGARVVVADIPFPISSCEAVVEAVMDKVSDRTRLAMFDHVTSPTALVLPVEELVSSLEARGVRTLVDGAHAPGMLPLQLDELGASYYTGNCHKWMCAPKGAALLWVRPDLQESVRPTVVSHGANSPRPGASRFEVEFGWVGTDDPTAFLTIPYVIDHFEAALPGGWEELREGNRRLVLAGRDRLCDALGVEPPAPDDMIGSLATVPLPARDDGGAAGAFDLDPLHVSLFEDYRIEVPVMAWPAPPRRVLRISSQAYNEAAEYAALAEALRETLA